jgi:hypothetical protein
MLHIFAFKLFLSIFKVRNCILLLIRSFVCIMVNL